MIGGPAVVLYGTYRASWGVVQRQNDRLLTGMS